MIRITNITVMPTAPFPGTDFRLVNPGETGRPGDDYFDAKDGQWKPDTNPVTDEPFDPTIHAPARRKKGPVYKPYDMESIPLPLVIRLKDDPRHCRRVIHAAYGTFADCPGLRIPYNRLFTDYTHDDGTPCGVLVSVD